MRAMVLGFGLLALAACADNKTTTPDAREGGLPDAPTGNLEPDGLETILEPLRAAGNLPALAAAVTSGERLLAIGAVGVRKLGDPTPVTRDDLWHLGSETKAMTAMLVAILVGDGTLGWDTTIAQALPAEAASLDASYRGVTVEELLQHRGGAPADVPAPIWEEMYEPGDPKAQRRTAVLAMLRQPPQAPPRTTFIYSNAGYMMAGLMLEEVTGRSWDELMRERLFTPLGMTSCGFGPPSRDDVTDQPWGHRNGAPLNTDNPPSLGPAGTVHCSLADWAKFLAAHTRRSMPGVDFTRLHTPAPGGDYALGWIVAQRPWGGTVLTHVGSNTLWYAVTWLSPEKDRAYLAVTNIAAPSTAAAVDEVFGPLIQRYPGP